MSVWLPESTAAQSAALTPVTQEMASDTRSFGYYDLARSLTDIDMVMLGNSPKFEALQDGYIRGVSAYYSEPLSAGVISIVLTRNGAVITNVALNMTIDGSIPANIQRDKKFVAQHVDFAFVAGDFLGFRLTTNGVVTPQNRELNATIYVFYD